MLKDVLRNPLRDVLSGPDILSLEPIAWYKDSGIESTALAVSAWLDESGSGNDMVQASGALQPTESTLAGVKCVQAPIGTKYLQSASPFVGRTCIAVFQTDGFADNEYTVFGSELDSTPAFEIRWRAVTPQVSFDGITLNNGQGRYAFNGGPIEGSPTSNFSATVAADTTYIIVGEYSVARDIQRIVGRSDLYNNGNSKLGEVVWFDRVLDLHHRRMIVSYLANKFGVAI